MSWLSINLNDSLNSLKGQISTLTREVLSEEIEDGRNFRLFFVIFMVILLVLFYCCLCYFEIILSFLQWISWFQQLLGICPIHHSHCHYYVIYPCSNSYLCFNSFIVFLYLYCICCICTVYYICTYAPDTSRRFSDIFVTAESSEANKLI